MQFVARDGAEIYYTTYGVNGPWITLINGHTRTSSDFKFLAKKASEAGFRVLTFDNRGSGKTRYSGPFSLVDIMLDIQELWVQLAISGSHILGISMGGWISQLLASQSPGKVYSVILVSTSATRKDIPSTSHEWGQDIESITAKLTPYFSTDFLAKNHLLIKAMAKQIMQENQNSEFSSKAADQRCAMADFNLEGLAEKISVPVCIIHGEADRIIPANFARDLNSKIQGSELVLAPGIGHLLLAECPKLVYDTATQFWRENRNLGKT